MQNSDEVEIASTRHNNVILIFGTKAPQNDREGERCSDLNEFIKDKIAIDQDTRYPNQL